MAGSRRGRSKGGFPGTELRGTLGGLIRSALGQAGVVRDVLERGAREGRARLDDARLERQRADALADLGEAVLAAIRRGDLADLEDLPEIAHAVAALDDLDARMEDADDRRRSRDPRDGRGDEGAIAPRRARFDHGDAPWQRVRDERDEAEMDDAEVEEPRRGRGGGGDGTVSSASWRPPRPAAPQRVWRPPVDSPPADEPATPERAALETGEETAVDRPARRRTTQPKAEAKPVEPKPEPKSRRPAPRAGGISFASDEDNDDLESYMHPDDVPTRERDKK